MHSAICFRTCICCALYIPRYWICGQKCSDSSTSQTINRSPLEYTYKKHTKYKNHIRACFGTQNTKKIIYEPTHLSSNSAHTRYMWAVSIQQHVTQLWILVSTVRPRCCDSSARGSQKTKPMQSKIDLHIVGASKEPRNQIRAAGVTCALCAYAKFYMYTDTLTRAPDV